MKKIYKSDSTDTNNKFEEKNIEIDSEEKPVNYNKEATHGGMQCDIQYLLSYPHIQKPND